MTPPPPLELLTLGPLELLRDGEPDAAFPSRRVRAALLVYLALEGPVARDRLLGLLWGDRPEERARHVLNQTLYEIRRDMGESVVESTGLHLRLDESVDVDVHALRRATAEGADGRVIELYRGHFLDGFFVPEAREFNEWAENTAAELRRLHFEAFSREVDRAAEAEGPEPALDLARSWVRWHPDEERPRVVLARLLLRAGRRDEARREHERWAEHAREERGRPPDGTLWGDILEELSPLERRASQAPQQAFQYERRRASFPTTQDDNTTLHVVAGGASGPRLVLFRAPGQEEVYRLETGENVVGRTDGHLCFPENRALSTRHATVVVKEGEEGEVRCILRDLESRNGTYLKIGGPRPLADGEVFLTGRQVFQLRRRR